MKVLTDTHTLVWALARPDLLGKKARTALARQPYTASVANLWELVVKANKSNALILDPLPWWESSVAGSGIPTLPIRMAHVRVLARLPELHRDPFDRILIAQAIAEGCAILSKDSTLAKYSVEVIWD